MEQYFAELNWNYDFSQHLEELLNIVNGDSDWERRGWKIVGKHPLLNLEVFRKLNEQLIANNLAIRTSVIRKTRKGEFGVVHSDGVGPANQKDTLSLVLNIPLLNPEIAITCWYDLSKDQDLKDEIHRNDLIDFKNTQLKPTSDEGKTRLGNCRTHYFRMTGPVLINPSTPHNVINESNDQDRIILSVNFSKIQPSACATWEDRHIITGLEF